MMNEKKLPPWHWDETRHAGTDYDSVEEVARYDARMAELRNVAAEHAEILAMLNAPNPIRILEIGCGTGAFQCPASPAQQKSKPTRILEIGCGTGAFQCPASPAQQKSKPMRILEIGCGTGAFSRAAAAAGHRVTAADVSAVMLDYAASKTAEAGLSERIDFVRGGFLTLALPQDSPDASFDAAVSWAVLHHLPDAWKAQALQRVCRWLRPGGRFILGDVVFAPAADTPQAWSEHCEAMVAAMPEALKTPMARHIAQEYSTLDWIMSALLERAGFEILEIRPHAPIFCVYDCRKRPGNEK